MARKKPPDTGLIVPQSTAAILQVKTWITEGARGEDILESVAAAYPGERPDVLLSQALAEIADESKDIDPDLARGFLLSAAREVFRRALEVNDFGNALSALKLFEKQVKV
ncbi:MAG: hypothetical protein NTY19_24050 [Planctomycetota bacterium]|nr:hypothetical protein [Planctomycetota bacterium]